ncbi:MAG: hypothetical protein ACKVH8_24460 [Pirellulales bacterium]|jgi:hypothetical protein
MDPLRLCISICPLAAYLMVLGVLNIRQHPFLTTGTRDMVALSLAVSGMMFTGPMALFMPGAAAALFGVYAWLMMLGIYFLIVIFISLMQRPRLVIYNITVDQLKPILREIAAKIDPEARWRGDALYMPSISVHFVVEGVPAMRNVQLKSVGLKQSYMSWVRLRVALLFAFRRESTIPNNYGYSLIVFASVMFTLAGYEVFRQPELVKIAWNEIMFL